MLSVFLLFLSLGDLTEAISHGGILPSTRAAVRVSSNHRATPTKAHATTLRKLRSTLGPKPTQRFLSTYTEDGKILGCTDLATLTEPFLTYTAGQVNCAGEAVVIRTISIPTKTKPSENAADTSSAALSGCTAVTSTDNDKNSYCQCDNGESIPRNLYTDGKKTQELCDGNKPEGDWFPIPKSGPLAPWMADVPDDDQCAHPNTTENLGGECWNKLHLSEYTKWWWDNFGSTCSSYGGNDTPFADCFLDKMFEGPAQCANITTVADCNKPVWESDNWNSIRNFYVGHTIWNMNQFFYEYWTALDSAHGTLGTDIDSIKKIVDPPDPPPPPPQSNDVLGKIFGVLSFGLAFLPPPFGEISAAVVEGVQLVNGLTETFFPSKTPGGQSIPKVSYHEISDNIDQVVIHIRDQIVDGCSTMLSDATVFVGFAQNGAFTGALPDLPTLTNILKKRLNTFIVAEALSSINVMVGRADGTDIQALQASQKLNWSPNCASYDDQSICDTYWFDKEKNATYSLLNPGDNDSQSMNFNFNGEMMALFPTYTTPEELFRGSYSCGSSSGDQTPTLQLKKNANGVIIPVETCMADMLVCNWERSPPKSKKWDMKNLDVWFSDCSAQDVLPRIGEYCFAGGKGGGLTWINPTEGKVRVPRGYLGWGLYNDGSVQNSGLISLCNGDWIS